MGRIGVGNRKIGVRVAVGTGVRVLVGVCVGGIGVQVAVGMGVKVLVGTLVGVSVGTGVGVSGGMGVGVSGGIGVGVSGGIGVGVSGGMGVGVSARTSIVGDPSSWARAGRTRPKPRGPEIDTAIKQTVNPIAVAERVLIHVVSVCRGRQDESRRRCVVYLFTSGVEISGQFPTSTPHPFLTRC